MQKALISLIQDAQSTGGIITFTDGLSAPVADLLWTDLGETILKAHDALKKEGVEIQLDIDEVDYSSKDAVDKEENHYST